MLRLPAALFVFLVSAFSAMAQLCVPGEFSPTGMVPCAPCLPGTFSSASGALLCDDCPAGSFASAPGSSSCTLCAADTFAPSPGASACLPCPPGSSSPPGATACTPDPTTTTTTTTTTTIPAPTLCDPLPASGCRLAQTGASTLKIRNETVNTRDQLRWRWSRGATTDLDSFKNPVSGTATYRLCVYDASINPQPLLNADVPAGGTPAGAVCGTRPCWKANGTTGFTYRDRDTTPDGIARLSLKAGVAGRAKVYVKGKGELLDPPGLPLTVPVTLQLLISDGVTTECWQTTYATSSINGGVKFIARGP